MRSHVAEISVVACVVVALAGSSVQADSLFDVFDTGLNLNRWQMVQTDAMGAPWSITAPDGQGRLRISKPADNDTSTLQSYLECDVVSRFTLEGDFTIIVDFSLFDFATPGDGGLVSSRLWVYFPDGFFIVCRHNRNNEGSYQYAQAGSVFGGNDVVLSAAVFDGTMVGRYKITRQGNTVSGFIDDGSGFVLLGQASDPRFLGTASDITLAATDYPDEWQRPRPTYAIDVRYDNFMVTADTIVPEPSTILLLGYGGLSVLGGVWRRRRR
jgi:hypothetical protein